MSLRRFVVCCLGGNLLFRHPLFFFIQKKTDGKGEGNLNLKSLPFLVCSQFKSQWKRTVQPQSENAVLSDFKSTKSEGHQQKHIKQRNKPRTKNSMKSKSNEKSIEQQRQFGRTPPGRRITAIGFFFFSKLGYFCFL